MYAGFVASRTNMPMNTNIVARAAGAKVATCVCVCVCVCVLCVCVGGLMNANIVARAK